MIFHIHELVMKRVIFISCIVIGGCSSNSPEPKDIQRELEKDLASCYYIEISDIKKENGMEGESKNEYIVEQKYTATFKPSSTQVQIMKDSLNMKSISESHKEKSKEIGKEIDSISKEHDAKRNLVYSDPAAVLALDEEYRKKINILKEKREDLAKQYGFPSYIHFESPEQFLMQQYTAKAQYEFLNECKPFGKMRSNGRNIVEAIFKSGIGKVLLEGNSVELSQRRIYRKSENGWIVNEK